MKDIEERKIEALEALTDGQAKADKGADRRQEKLTSSLAQLKDQQGDDDRDHDLFDDEDGDRKRKRQKGRLGKAARKGKRLFRSFGRLVKGGSKLLGRAAAPLAILSALPGLVRAFKAGDREQIGQAGGSLVGGAGGAAAGAAIGTAILPGIGTIIGGAVGAFTGDFVGGKVGETLGSMARPGEPGEDDRERIGEAEDIGSLGGPEAKPDATRAAQEDGSDRQEKPETTTPSIPKGKASLDRPKAEKPVVVPSRLQAKPKRQPGVLIPDLPTEKRIPAKQPSKKPVSTPSWPQRKAEQEQTGKGSMAVVLASVARKERESSFTHGQEAADRRKDEGRNPLTLPVLHDLPKDRDRRGRLSPLPDLRKPAPAKVTKERPPEPQAVTGPPAIPAWMETGIAQGIKARKEQEKRERIFQGMADAVERSFQFRKTLIDGLQKGKVEARQERQERQEKTFPQRWKDHDENTLTLMHYDRL